MMKIATLIGTRPEAIKMRPVIDALEDRGVDVWEFNSGQSADLVPQEDTPRWNSMRSGIARILQEFDFENSDIDALLVQGDTATAFAGAVAGFLAEVPVGHVEAGLRTYSDEPYPEEAFRHAIASFATWHFCPDGDSAWNLIDEFGGHYNNILITGNPIIDTLDSEPFRVLVTLHRRENWGERIQNARRTLYEFADDNDNVQVRVITHPNWDSHQESMAISMDSVSYREFEPVDHKTFTELMRDSDLIVTDSGGLQEEAAHFGVDCLVVRSQTERSVLRRLGAVDVVDPDNPDELAENLSKRLHKRRAYGDGTAGDQIADILIEELSDAASD